MSRIAVQAVQVLSDSVSQSGPETAGAQLLEDDVAGLVGLDVVKDPRAAVGLHQFHDRCAVAEAGATDLLDDSRRRRLLDGLADGVVHA